MPTLTVQDDFAGTGDLDATMVGSSTTIAWDVLAGSAIRDSGFATFAQAASASPFAVADVGAADVDAQVKTKTGRFGGDALYFRVSDASNWWRLRCRYYLTSSGYYGAWYGTGWVLTGGSVSDHSLGSGTSYSGYQHGVPTSKTTYWNEAPDYGVDYYSQSVTRDSYSSTNYYYFLILDKCVAGAVTQVDTFNAGAFGTLRVVLADDQISYYKTNGIDVAATVTDGFNKTATEFGVGLGGSDSYVYGSALTDFVVAFPGSTQPPSIVSPETGTDLDFANPVITLASNFGDGDPLTNLDVQWKKVGDPSFTVVNAARTTPGDWTFPTAGLTAPQQIEIQARATDSYSNTTAYTPSSFFTLRDAPSAPTFVSPAEDSTVVAQNIAVVDFDDTVAATGKQARRMGDDGTGSVDPLVVYEDDLTIDPTPHSATLPEIDAYFTAQITAVAGAPAGILTEPGDVTLNGFTATGNRSIYTVYDSLGASSGYTLISRLGTGAANGAMSFQTWPSTSWGMDARTAGAAGAQSLTLLNSGDTGRRATAYQTENAMTLLRGHLSGVASTTRVLTPGTGMETSPTLYLTSPTSGVVAPLITMAFNAAQSDSDAATIVSLMLAWADARDSLTLPYYLLSGNPAIHPVGTEHIQVRRQTAASGTLWSPWTDRRLLMALAPPEAPTVVYTPHPNDISPSVHIRVEFTAPDGNHSATTGCVIYRAGIPVGRFTVDNNQPVAMVDYQAKARANYTVASTADNGSVSYAIETSTVGTPSDDSPLLLSGTPSNFRGVYIGRTT